MGQEYVDEGATATDNLDNSLFLTANILTTTSAGALPLDTSMIGEVLIFYDVSDAAGNQAVQTTRTVQIIAAQGCFSP